MTKIKGCIDPGHAESTPGKRAGTGSDLFLEYLSNRIVAAKLKALLEATGHFDIIYSCDVNSSYDASLTSRAQKAIDYGCAFLVSIHSNAFDETAKGTETLINLETTASVPFANEIHNELVEALGTVNRGVKRQNLGVLNASYKHMLCCLTEGEFFTNPIQRAWMLTEDYSNKYARGVFNGLCSFYNIAVEPQPTPPQADSYQILTGGLSAESVKVITEFFIQQNFWAEMKYRKDVNPRALTGGLQDAKLAEVEAWLKAKGWYYKVYPKGGVPNL